MEPIYTKPIHFIASSRKELQAFPDPVRKLMGIALFYAQLGAKHDQAKPLKGFGSAGILEVAEDYDGETYRAVYTVRFHGVIYVLHCFQKKSKTGIKTPQSDIELIKKRLKIAENDWRQQQK